MHPRLFVVLALLVVGNACSDEREETFSIRPGADGSVTSTQRAPPGGLLTCELSWQDVVGDAEEHWTFLVNPDRHMCTALGPLDSQVMFGRVQARFSGFNGSTVEVAIYTGNGRKLVRDVDFQQSSEFGSLTVALNSTKFYALDLSCKCPPADCGWCGHEPFCCADLLSLNSYGYEYLRPCVVKGSRLAHEQCPKALTPCQ
jgi:hypothetical protein